MFHNEIYDYPCAIEMVYSFSAVEPHGATYAMVVHKVDGTKLLKDSYCMGILNGCYQPRSVRVLRDADDINLALEPPLILYGFRIDGKSISTAQTFRLNKKAKILLGDVRRKATVTKTMYSFLSYARAREEEYGVPFVDMRMKDVKEDKPFSRSLPTSYRVSYKRYTGVSKMVI